MSIILKLRYISMIGMDLYTIIVCIYSCRDSSNSWDVSRDGLMIQLTSGGGSLQVGKESLDGLTLFKTMGFDLWLMFF
jgi:hypothetical protein